MNDIIYQWRDTRASEKSWFIQKYGYIAVYFHAGGLMLPLVYGIAGKEGSSEVSWSFLWVIFLGLLAAGVGGYAVYKYRIRVWLPFFII